MNSELGRIVSAVMIDENDQYYFVQPARNGQTYRLPKAESPQVLHIGGSVRGFVYENEDHQLAMTCQHIPKSRIDRYAFGTVVSVRRDLGVFVDIGLKDKDIAVSLDDLPEPKHLWPQPGDRLLMALKVDKHDRLWGQLADDEIFRAISLRPNRKLLNRSTDAVVYHLKLAGTLVLTRGYHLGFVHPSERDIEPRLGQKVHCRVIGLSEHGGLNISLKPRAYQAIGGDAKMLLAMLERNVNHRLPYTDKTNPTVIKTDLGISKGAFKRAVGHLLKTGQVSEHDGQLWLTENHHE